MTLERSSRLESGGIDVAQALERVMGNEALLERLLGRFLDDPQYPALCAALERGDMEQAVRAAHTLKGMCGNLSMTELFQLFTAQVEVLRGGDLMAGRALMAQIAPAYERVAAAIRGSAEDGRA
mgnify:FL=1